ncbi:PREDICTED: helicase POLQ-like [Nicrophorus vespilloides]|uniref:Helicase POLQ-like n=1 Tax=Nicrophorus vespilloides TaxID=110193 RepID=A0ABM1MNF6_NICVS|nr:PREDICTED: helicase POLQ-like [Nicrophorus vespilloides]
MDRTSKDLTENILNSDLTLLNNFTMPSQQSTKKKKWAMSLKKYSNNEDNAEDSDTECSIVNSPIPISCKRVRSSNSQNRKSKKSKIFDMTFNESLISLKDCTNMFSQKGIKELNAANKIPSPLSDNDDLFKDLLTPRSPTTIRVKTTQENCNFEFSQLFNSTQILKQIDEVSKITDDHLPKLNSNNPVKDTYIPAFVSDEDLDLFEEDMTETNLTNDTSKPSTSKKFKALSHLDDIFNTQPMKKQNDNREIPVSKEISEKLRFTETSQKNKLKEPETNKENCNNLKTAIVCENSQKFKMPAVPKDKPSKFSFTQFCESSQALKHIDEVEAGCSKQIDKRVSDYSQLCNTQFTQQVERINSPKNNVLSKSKETVGFGSSKYREEMDTLFDDLESSICYGGKKTPTKKAITDLLEQTFRSPQIIKKAIQQAEKSLMTAPEEWKDDSLLADALINMSVEGQSIGDLMKKALMNNVDKCVSPPKIFNETVCEEKVNFRSYGQFYGLPDKVKELVKTYKGIDKLYDWQNECLNLPAIKSRKNLIYALPTSGGKTLVAEILLLREVLCRRKNVLFVLPFVAIVQEKVWSLSPFAVDLEFLVEEYAAGRGNFPPRKRRKKNSVYIATIEKALGLINSLIENDRLNELGLIVVDELHLVGDNSRGPNLEELLTKVLVSKNDIQIIGMSATIGNLKDICTFLKADVYVNDFRPVELVEYIKCGDEIAKVDVTTEEIFIFERKVNYKYADSLIQIDPDHLGGLVMEVIPNDSCLVFCRSKKNCENVAILLSKVVFGKLKTYKSNEKLHILKALEEESGNLCSILKTSILYGIAYHHSGLTSEERKIIEEGFRRGVISVICCTSTLAAGVNLPAKRVIVRNPYIGRDFINLSRYKQMAGRAGRAGLSELGESVIICAPNELNEVRKLFLSPMDVAMSSMHENESRGLRHFLLSCISLGLANTKNKLHEAANCTLLAVQKDCLEVDLKGLVKSAIRELFKMGALQVQGNETEVITKRNNVTFALDTSVGATQQVSEAPETSEKTVIRVTNDSILVISQMGHAAIKGGLDLAKAHMLYEDLLEAQFKLVLLTGLHLMYLVTPYDLSEQINPSLATYYNIYNKLNNRELQTAKVLGLTEAVAVKMITNKKITEVSKRVMNRFYVTLMLYDLWNEMSVYDVAIKYDINRGLIQNLMTSASTFASNVYHFCEEFEEFWAFSLLIKGMSERLSHCCVKELVPLMTLPSVKQNRARQLFQAGYKTLQSVAKAKPEDLMNAIEYMSRKLANQLIAAAKMILLERVENLREEAEDVLEGIGN